MNINRIKSFIDKIISPAYLLIGFLACFRENFWILLISCAHGSRDVPGWKLWESFDIMLCLWAQQRLQPGTWHLYWAPLKSKHFTAFPHDRQRGALFTYKQSETSDFFSQKIKRIQIFILKSQNPSALGSAITYSATTFYKWTRYFPPRACCWNRTLNKWSVPPGCQIDLHVTAQQFGYSTVISHQGGVSWLI